MIEITKESIEEIFGKPFTDEEFLRFKKSGSEQSYYEWEANIYPKLWRQYYDLGAKAKLEGKARKCDLKDKPGERSIKVWEEAWYRGYDNKPWNYMIPDEFKQVEKYLDTLLLEKVNSNG